MFITRSKSGLPCLWESGGAGSNTGSAVVIAAASGSPKRAIYVRTRGELCNSNHALIPVVVGDLVIRADQHRLDYEITVSRIIGFDGDEASLEVVNHFSEGEWDVEPTIAMAAVEAAKRKAAKYHCRTAYWAEERA